MNIKVAPAGTPLENAEHFNEIGRAFSEVGFALEASMRQVALAAEQARRSFTRFSAAYDFMMTRRERRRMQTALARIARRPALIHNGKKHR